MSFPAGTLAPAPTLIGRTNKFLPKPGIFELFCKRHMVGRRPRSPQSLFSEYSQPRVGWSWRLCYNHKYTGKMRRRCIHHQVTERPTFPADSLLHALMKKLPCCRGPHHKKLRLTVLQPRGTESGNNHLCLEADPFPGEP